MTIRPFSWWIAPKLASLSIVLGLFLTTVCHAAPNPPTDVVVVPRYESPITLVVSWTDNSGDETGFEIERCEQGGACDFRDTVGFNVQTYVDGTATADKMWQYRVRALGGAAGDSAWTALSNASSPKIVWLMSDGSYNVLNNYGHPLGSAAAVGNIYYHDGVDFSGGGVAVVAARGGIVSGTVLSDNGTVLIDVDVGAAGMFTDVYGHITTTGGGVGPVPGVGDPLAPGDTLANASNTFFLMDPPADHVHWETELTAGGGKISVLTLYSANADRDPNTTSPIVADVNNDGEDFIVVDAAANDHTSPRNPAWGGVDFLVDAYDDMSAGNALKQSPHRIAYWIEAGVAGGDNVQSAADPYVLLDHDFQLCGSVCSPEPSAMAALYAALPANLSGINTWQSYLTYVVTNTDDTDGDPNNVDPNQFWRTDARRGTGTRANGSDANKARENQEARFPDGTYFAHIVLNDIVNNADYTRSVVIDNSRPYVKRVTVTAGLQTIYQSQWVWDGASAQLVAQPATFAAAAPFAALRTQDVRIEIEFSEPMATASLGPIATLGVTPTLTSTQPVHARTIWQGLISNMDIDDGGANDGRHMFTIDGTDTAGNALLQINNRNAMAADHHNRDAAGVLRGPVGTDTIHGFRIGPVTDVVILEPTETFPAWAGTSTDGNRVFVRLLASEGLDLSLDNLSISVGDTVLNNDDQIALHSSIESETWLVITPGTRLEDCYDLSVDLVNPPDVRAVASRSLCYEDGENRTFDRVVAIDRTNSMLYDSISRVRSEEKMNAARAAGRFFVDLSKDDLDAIGAVSFQRTDEDGDGSIEADELSEPELQLELVNEDRRQADRNAISAITPGVGPGGEETSLGAGLLEAKTMLDARGRADSEKIIVLVTDGRENYPPYWFREGDDESLKPRFTEGDSRTRIDTVSIGLDAENGVLRDMAESTGGIIRNELEGTGSLELLSRLAATFKAIDEDIRGEQRFYYQEGFPETVIGGEFEEIREGRFTVEPNLDWMTVAFHWSLDGAAHPLRLFRPDPDLERFPDGVLVDTTRTDEKHAVYHVSQPQAGVWRYEVSIAKPSAEFFAAASGPTLLTARLRIGKATPNPAGRTDTPLRVWIAEDSAVLGAEVTGSVRRPDRLKLALNLRDDGSSADGARLDGVYGAVVETGLAGPYVVDLVARGTSNSGEPFERYLSGTFLIAGGPEPPPSVGEARPGIPGQPPTGLCGGPAWCCWLLALFAIVLVAALLLLARYLCDPGQAQPLHFVVAFAIASALGWWLLTSCIVALCWFLLTIAVAVIVAGAIGLLTPIVPCMGLRWG